MTGSRVPGTGRSRRGAGDCRGRDRSAGALSRPMAAAGGGDGTTGFRRSRAGAIVVDEECLIRIQPAARVPPMRGGIRRSDGAFMRALIRIACLAVLAFGSGAAPAAAQATPQPADSRVSPPELVDTGDKFFVGALPRLAPIIERAV